MPNKKPSQSPRRLAGRPARTRKARAAGRKPFRFTLARRAALDEARKKRKFIMTPAKWSAIRKAAEANRRNFRLTPTRLKSMGVNIRKAQAASVHKFHMTPARQQANLANIQKAWTAPRSPESRARSSFNRLKHGLLARNFERALRPFGEDPAEFQAHLAALERTFAPQDDEERGLVKRIAETIWLRFRLFRAQARWVAARLKRRLRALPRLEHPDAEATRQRAAEIMGALLEDDWIYAVDNRLLRQAERRLGALLQRRGGGDLRSAILPDTPDPELVELDKIVAESRLWERVLEGGPEVEAVLEKLRPPGVRPK